MNSHSFYTSGVFTEHYLGMRWPKAIWAAVLEQAIQDIVNGPAYFEEKAMTPAQCADLRTAAEDWVDDRVNEPRRFEWVCEVLGLDSEAVRRSIEERRVA